MPRRSLVRTCSLVTRGASVLAASCTASPSSGRFAGDAAPGMAQTLQPARRAALELLARRPCGGDLPRTEEAMQRSAAAHPAKAHGHAARARWAPAARSSGDAGPAARARPEPGARPCRVALRPTPATKVLPVRTASRLAMMTAMAARALPWG